MPVAEPPVIAAIPNYNMGASLAILLPQVIAQGYDAIFVLDDHSTDDSVRIAQQFKKVTVIQGNKNVGSGANRNRILQVTAQWPTAIIHFIDADMRLLSTSNPHLIRQLFKDESIGVLGGLIRTANGLQSAYNFGPRISLAWAASGIKRLSIHAAGSHSRKVPSKPPRRLRKWPNIFAVPTAQDAHYVLEGNMCIRMRTLQDIGGFHATLRFNEAQDLGDKIAAGGLRTRFDPGIDMMHLAIDVRGTSRYTDGFSTSFHLLHKSKWRLK